jgi:hypothetical protein
MERKGSLQPETALVVVSIADRVSDPNCTVVDIPVAVDCISVAVDCT